ncbi:hypothetical protein Pdw03_7238 [Penicillium digitatum]|uniref:Uncharacterized protein n=1 Tax=Penicillium digitatum TaxID=36651 RepID=A0A7T6XLR8_PENDI|nr:hypothetical protein Pdw03_7238 [Penicillium digitatum]
MLDRDIAGMYIMSPQTSNGYFAPSYFVLRRTLLPYFRVCPSFIPLSLIDCFILFYTWLPKLTYRKSSLFTDVEGNTFDSTPLALVSSRSTG